MSKLVEKVARALCLQEEGCLPNQSSGVQGEYYALARAAIAAVVDGAVAASTTIGEDELHYVIPKSEIDQALSDG